MSLVPCVFPAVDSAVISAANDKTFFLSSCWSCYCPAHSLTWWLMMRLSINAAVSAPA